MNKIVRDLDLKRTMFEQRIIVLLTNSHLLPFCNTPPSGGLSIEGQDPFSPTEEGKRKEENLFCMR